MPTVNKYLIYIFYKEDIILPRMPFCFIVVGQLITGIDGFQKEKK